MFELDSDQMRALGYRVIDMLVTHHENLNDLPATGHASRETMEALLREPLPEQPSDPETVLQQFERDVVPYMMPATHPRFFAFIPGPSSFVGAMGDALGAGFNMINALYLESAGPAQLELVTVDWLRQLLGFPEGTGGLFVSGGSVANLTALAAMRQIKLDNRAERGVVYCSEQTHGSLTKNLKLLGFRPDNVFRLPVDAHNRMDISALEYRIAEDRNRGLTPCCVIATAGTTNTGAVDPLGDIARICKSQDLWFHIDGAYGAAAMLCEQGRKVLAGLEQCDSLAIDPHKWLFQPIECGCVLVRDPNWLRQTFGDQTHEYMQDADVDDDHSEVNFCDYGIQLTRGLRALKLWMSLKVYGVQAFRDAVKQGLKAAERAEALLTEHENIEIVTPAQLGIVSFRYVADDFTQTELDVLNAGIIEACMADGYAMLSSTRLRERTVLRLCTINPRTTDEDLQRTVELIVAAGRSRSKNTRR